MKKFSNIILPFNKKLVLNNQYQPLFSSYSTYTELGVLNHPGSFGYKRKFHFHEGIDFYCELNDKVLSICNGTIHSIELFTGEEINSPWWNTTYCVIVKTVFGFMNYGEIQPNSTLYVGKKIKKGDFIGNSLTVLKKNKNRPQTMLHFELYSLNTKKFGISWNIDQPKPINLIDPTSLFSHLL